MTGHVDLLFPTEYIKAADLHGREVTVIVDRVEMEPLVMAGGKRERKPVVHMKSAKGRPLSKRWVIGKTVAKQIAEATGERMVDRWAGKAVTMYPTTCRGKEGKEVECIRVRVRVNPNAQEVTEDMAAEPAAHVDFADEAGADEEPAT